MRGSSLVKRATIVYTGSVAVTPARHPSQLLNGRGFVVVICVALLVTPFFWIHRLNLTF